MAGEDKQQIGLQVLKGFNTAVTTTKLYPPQFPQVATSVEQAYELITGFFDRFGTLSFGLVEDRPILCGLPVSEKTLGKVHGEDIFRQLKLLQLEHLVFEEELDRETFKALLTLFTTSPQLINKEGGSRAFVVNLGLDHIFPEDYVAELPVEREDSFALALEQLTKSGRVHGEDLLTITHEIDGETSAGQKKISTLAERTAEPGKMADLVTAAVAQLLVGLQRSGEVKFPPSFITLMHNVNRVVDSAELSSLAQSAALVCSNRFSLFGLHALFLQNYPDGFGSAFFEQLILASVKNFDEIMLLIRKEQDMAVQMRGESSDQYRLITEGINRLLSTERGKQYLIREEAKNALSAGEKERQAKRIQAGIRQILQGDVTGLRNREVVRSLPATIESLISKGKDKAAATIITNITTELLKSDDRSHDLLGECLGNISESLINTEKWEWLEKLSVPLLAWTKEANKPDEVLENIIEILLKLQKYYWDNDKEKPADTILKLFFAIRTGKLEKDPEVVEIVSRLQDYAVKRSTLSAVLKSSVEQESELVDRRLIMQGPLATRFLLNKLLDSQNTQERLKILQLLRRKKYLLPPILLEKLATPMPWHGKRNLLKLLSETGSEEHARKIIEYLNHEDIRVQKEAFTCIQALSGEDLKDNLLDALSFASGPMMEQVVRALPSVSDEEVVGAVAELFVNWKHFPDEIRDSLLVQAAKFLGRSRNLTAETALEEFLQLENKLRARAIGDGIWEEAKQALRKLKTLRREQSKRELQQTRLEAQEAENEIESQVAADEQQGEEEQQRSTFTEEDHIKALVEQGDISRAKNLLVDIIGKAARRERFDEAVRLREWLIEIDPSALGDIIHTAEIIEDAKSEGIGNDYLEIWSSLHDNLTSEEFNAMYYSMQHSSHPAETVLVQQGDTNPALFFVNQGEVKLYHGDKNKEALLKVVHQGQIFGADTFFDASVWTVSAVTLRRTEISTLPYGSMERWSVEHPALESKLYDFTSHFRGFEKKIEDRSKERRKHKRFNLHGVTQMSISDKDEGDTVTQMNGELANISLGGLGFMLRISRKKNARILLGRKISVKLSCTGGVNTSLTIQGELVSVRSLYSMENEFSAHLKFSRQLSEKEMASILEANPLPRDEN